LDAQRLIGLLGLTPHPSEGGYFRETYRSAETLPPSATGNRYGAERSVCTAIYYLLTPDSFSAMHRLRTDEIFHFYLGDPVELLMLYPEGEGENRLMGPDIEAGQTLQAVVPRGVWQGLALRPGGRFALLGTTVAPGFDYADFELGARDELLRLYPAFAARLVRLTRE
jgi:uncharacterized protein